MKQHQHDGTPPDDFAEQPDYLDAETGGESELPALIVQHDGPAPTTPYPARSFTTGQFPVASDATSCAPHNPARRRLTITNTGAKTVFLAPSQGECTATSGYPLVANAAPMVLETSHAVWVCTAVGDVSTVAVLAQLEDGR